MINLELIKSLNPCQNRLDNYIKHYGNRCFTKRQFMGLKSISHEDKLWVAVQLLPEEKARLAAADIAELVLPVFENKFPEDNRPRLAIEAARKGPSSFDQAKAYEAYRDTLSNSAAYAAYCATCSDLSHAASATEYAAGESNAVIKKKIRTIILKYWNSL